MIISTNYNISGMVSKYNKIFFILTLVILFSRPIHSSNLDIKFDIEEKYAWGKDIGLTLIVTNVSSSSIKLTFHTGQEFDFVIMKNNQEFWRWSKGYAFTQAIHEMTLQPNSSLIYNTTWYQKDNNNNSVSPGVYTASAYFYGHLDTNYQHQTESQNITIFDTIYTYPNPAKSTNKIVFNNLFPSSEIEIYTISGELVKVIDNINNVNTIVWDTTNNLGEGVASGIYLYLIKGQAGYRRVSKIAIIR